MTAKKRTKSKMAASAVSVKSTALLGLVADIRAAVGDSNGKLMQDELVEHCRKLAHSADWNRRRVEMLSRLQKHMREPERTLVCDIIANHNMPIEDHAKVERDGFKVPLLGIPPDAVLQKCELCHNKYPLRDVEMSSTGQILCNKCQSTGPANAGLGKPRITMTNATRQPELRQHSGASLPALDGSAIPRALFSCSNEYCRAEVSHHADQLYWYALEQRWVCENCWDNLPELADDGGQPTRGVTLAEHIIGGDFKAVTLLQNSEVSGAGATMSNDNTKSATRQRSLD